MKKTRKKFYNAKDKIMGEIKEAAGKMTGNEQLELQGKIQAAKANIKTKIDDVKEDIANVINHTIDKKEKNNIGPQLLSRLRDQTQVGYLYFEGY